MGQKRLSIMARRFRGYLPVVVDVETAGFNPERDALLEIAAVTLQIDEQGLWQPDETHFCHLIPFEGANLNQKALDFIGVDPFHPFRFAVKEAEGLESIFKPIRKALKHQGCTRAILVGHNPSFDLSFIMAACKRCRIKYIPFHSFSTFDTATLGGLAYQQTVLAKAVQAAGFQWDNSEAHSAIYDAQRTADLFCRIVNLWDKPHLLAS
jgi:ribonuclease T